MRRRTSKAGAEAGYTYVAILAIVTVAAIAAQTAQIPPQSARIRDAEEELLFRGQAYANAIESYYLADPERPAFPQSLSDLLNDPREAGRRHIRQLWSDPISDTPWQIIQDANGGGITGVAPASGAAPRKRAFFPEGMQSFDGADRYADWRFEFLP